jgi:hypothetical protein
MTADNRDRDVPHRRIGLGVMPMAFTVAGGDVLLLAGSNRLVQPMVSGSTPGEVAMRKFGINPVH